jgi:hypothetical protein
MLRDIKKRHIIVICLISVIVFSYLAPVLAEADKPVQAFEKSNGVKSTSSSNKGNGGQNKSNKQSGPTPTPNPSPTPYPSPDPTPSPSPTPTPSPTPISSPTPAPVTTQPVSLETKPQEWEGVGSDYKITMDSTSSIQNILYKWENEEIPLIKANGFNTVRLAFAMRPEDHHSLMVYSDMDQVIDLLGRNGIYVILDLHNWQDNAGVFGSQEWIDFWVATANHYKDNPYVVAYELFNEPFTSTWASWMVNGGAGRDGSNHDPWKALAMCVDAIRATGDTHIIVYPDPWFWNSYTDTWHPENYVNSQYARTNIVIASHEWWRNESIQDRITKIDQWRLYFTVWLGEINGWNPTDGSEGQIYIDWTRTMTSNFIQNNGGFNYWLHGKSRSVAWNITETCLSGIYPQS